MQNENELQDQRFLKIARAYESLHVTIGHLRIDAVQRLEERGIKAKTWLPSEGLIGDIKWASIKPDGEDLYTISIEAGNAFQDTLGRRIGFIDELRSAGQIPPDVATRLITSGDADLEAWTLRMQGQWNWIERIICEIHDDESKDIKTEGPDPMMDIPLAALQMKQAYLELCSWKDSPEPKKRAMRDFYTLCLQEMNKQAAPAAPAAPTPPAPGDMGAAIPQLDPSAAQPVPSM
jgi:hypothetical protein